MSQVYPFAADADWYHWSIAFAAAVAERGSEWGLLPVVIEEMRQSADAFARAYLAATDPTTRGRVTVRTREDAYKRMRRAAIQAVAMLQANQSVSDETRASLGLRVRSTTRSRIAAPTLAPTIFLQATGATSAQAIVRDVTSPNRRARPAGVTTIEFKAMIGDAPIGNPMAWPIALLSGRTRVSFDWPHLNDLTTVWMAARWLNRKGEAGPYSTIASVRLAGTGVRPLNAVSLAA